jgi:hypothetical protein
VTRINIQNKTDEIYRRSVEELLDAQLNSSFTVVGAFGELLRV